MTHRRRFLSSVAVSLLVAGVVPSAGSAATAASPWSAVSARLSATHAGNAREVAPRTYRAFRLDQTAFVDGLRGAALETTAASTRTIVSIPAPDGGLQRFAVLESPVMEPALAAEVPSFRSYAVTGVDDPTATGRIDVSTLGFHATIRSDRGVWLVDPAYRNDRSAYVSYKRSALPAPPDAPAEGRPPASNAARGASGALATPGAQVVRRTYRIALASDPKYAAIVGTANVDVKKAIHVNRANEIFNDDLAMQFVLVANNNLLNFDTQAKLTAACGVGQEANCYTTSPTGNVSCDDPSDNLHRNQRALDTIIGDTNYDVGHLLSTDGAGLASRGAGQPGDKATGCSGITDVTGDLYIVEFYAHELAHQFGATHSFNAGGADCAPNRAAEGAIEPASGSSIMSYAGVCSSDNIQGQSDPYFNQLSIKQIEDYASSAIPGATNGGSTTTVTPNHSPVVTVPASQAIPPRTPFTLTGSATDADADVPVYIWEQADLAGPVGTELGDNNKPDGPLFRQFSTAAIVPTYDTEVNAPGESVAKTTDNVRTFPDLSQIRAGNTNAATGSCPAATLPTPTAAQVECFSEFLPTTARTLHFDLIARDRKAGGGGVSKAETTVTVAGTTPFRVATPAVTTLQGNRFSTLTWDVAGTTAAPISVANVRVLYSTDGGLTFPTEVLASTPNDGSQVLTVPNTATSTGRFKVEAIGQPFFDISHADLSVTPNTPLAALSLTQSVTPGAVARGASATYTLVVTNTGPTAAQAVKLFDPLPAGLTFTSATPASCTLATGTVTCELGALPAGGSRTVTIDVTAGTEPTVVNTATLSSTTAEDDASDNTSSTTLTVAQPGPAAVPPAPVPPTPGTNVVVPPITPVTPAAVGRARVTGTSIRVSGRAKRLIAVPISCPAGTGSCSGSLVLVATRSMRIGSKTIKAGQRFASTRFTLAGGKKAVVSVRISKATAAALKRSKAIRIDVRTATGTQLSTRRITLRK